MEAITRKEAIERGLKRYFTGKPCKRGHVAERWVNNSTCIACALENERRYRAEDPARFLARRRRTSGLPEPTRSEPVRCELCEKEQTDRTIHLDHCHKTGEFRGWLCFDCNVGIGKLGDDIKGLERAIEYLKGNIK